MVCRRGRTGSSEGAAVGVRTYRSPRTQRTLGKRRLSSLGTSWTQDRNRCAQPCVGRLILSLLEISNVAKSFGAIRAVNGISLTVDAGEVIGLMGDNGAGKSTMVKLIAGNFPPSEGEIMVE